MAEDFDFEVPPMDEGEEKPNRTFITAVAAIGGLLILSLICLGVYTLVIAPRQREARERLPTEVSLTSTEHARLLTETAIADVSPVAVDDTPTPTSTTAATPTSTAAMPTSTPAITLTPTEVVIVATSMSTIQPTEDPLVATAQAQATINAAQQEAATATSTPTALPGTGGFADDIGIPAMLLLAAVMVTVIFVARHLRARSA